MESFHLHDKLDVSFFATLYCSSKSCSNICFVHAFRIVFVYLHFPLHLGHVAMHIIGSCRPLTMFDISFRVVSVRVGGSGVDC